MFSLMREFNDDPFFSSQMQHMESMMSPFGGLFGPPQRAAVRGGQQPHQGGGALMPFGFGPSLFPSMGDMFANFNQLSSQGNCHSFSSSSVMTYTTDENGRPQMYQASSSTRTAPGGVKETRRSVADSRSGVQELAIGHHLHDRGHVIEKKKNRYTGDEEDNEEFINLEDEEAEHFDREWQERARSSFQPRYHQHRSLEAAPAAAPTQQLAITDGGATAAPQHSTNEGMKKKSSKHKRKGHPKGSSSRGSPYHQ